MRISLLLAVVVALAVAASPVSTLAQSPSEAPDGVTARLAADESAPVTANFATLSGVSAVPMASAELNAVKGLHLHFFDANGGIHFIGRGQNFRGQAPIDYDNDSPDNVETGRLVHVGYRGLCNAGPILITPDGNGLSQC